VHPKADKTATTDHDVLDVIRARRSTRAFDPARPVEMAEQFRLFEAARWASSSANEQPWRFVVADRFHEPDAFDRMLAALTPSNQSWARSAALLVLVGAHPLHERTAAPNPYAWYDTGQAVSLLTIQATDMGLALRQMAGFDHAIAREAAGEHLGAGLEPVVLIAIGHPGTVETLPLERHRDAERKTRARRAIADFVTWLTALMLLAWPAGARTSAHGPDTAAVDAAPQTVSGYRVVNTYPHDRTAFTQGLIFKDGALYESTGQYGESEVRKVELTTGRVLQRTRVDKKYFAEGLTDWNGTLVQLTWTSGVGFVYDRETLAFRQTFRYSGEGWGLTHDGTRLIVSDGQAKGGLRFLDPVSFVETGRVIVHNGTAAVEHLNELEFVKGEVWANVWHTDRIARIDPKTGNVTGWIDLKGLLKRGEVTNGEAVLNGIAYDAATGRIFVTGKLWPKLFEIALTN
jgi:glutamine cyclotransferase/nitroreductase